MKIGICKSNESYKIKGIGKLFQKSFNNIQSDWSERFEEILKVKQFNYGIVYMDRSDWIDEIKKYDVLIWKPKFMGPDSSTHFREKIYFIQNILNKRIYPNYETTWHFDSKIAQDYIFSIQNIKTPKTFISFDYNEIFDELKSTDYPVIMKKSNGAGSTGVKMVNNERELKKIVNRNFIGKKILNKVFNCEYDKFPYLYIQQFLKGNTGDLRITVIGDKYVTGFWRLNRPNDFRASGSGNIDYEKPLPKNIIEYCVNISKKNNFDSMAYDILFNGDEFVIVEMSYGYVDKAVFDSKGYYTINKFGKVDEYITGNIYPQELWVNLLVENYHSVLRFK